MRKPNKKQLKIVRGMMLLSFILLTSLLYLKWKKYIFGDIERPSFIINTSTKYAYDGAPMRHMPFIEIYPGHHKNNPNESYQFEDFQPVYMIDTPGCKIPLSMLDYVKHIKKQKKYNGTCGKRAVFLKKIDSDKVQAVIKQKNMEKYLRKSVIFDCCYRFVSRRSGRGNIVNKKVKFTKCAKLQDSAIIKLETDFVNVQCFYYDERNISRTIYEDVYAFAKRINVSKLPKNDCKVKYNVLMIGMDSMSLPRFSQSLSRTVKYFENHSWLSYRGYHKVADNTFPNMMAFLTGRNLSDVLDKCANKMSLCDNLFIWNKFKEAGFVTAYGEDYLRLPDTFSDEYAFRIPPTDHYMRPFFLQGETELNRHSLVCAGKVSSAQQVLNYALDFANTYSSGQFFGLFWLNSFSHRPNSRPQDADVMLENFFNELAYTGLMENTIVIVLSDHGIRFGDLRLEVESYYDERMPFMFILPPATFVERHPFKTKSLVINQFRLVTPYDLYHTLNDINDISSCKNESRVSLEACPKCHSMFQAVTGTRTCQDLTIDTKWCSCHKLYPLPVQDTEGVKSIQMVVSHIKESVKNIHTRRCTKCVPLSLKNIIRIHFYYHEDKISIYYVVAFTLSPGNGSYEATVLLKEGKRSLVGAISPLTPYEGRGRCVQHNKKRYFCVCQIISNC